MNITVKSGTNSIHGVLFEDHTDQHMEAYPWTANRSLPNPKYINNQYGGTIGGADQERQIVLLREFRRNRLSSGFSIPCGSPHRADEDGQFKRFSRTRSTIRPRAMSLVKAECLSPGNIIPSNRIDPGVQALLNYSAANGNLWSLPNQAGIGSVGLTNNLLTNGETYLRRDQSAGKVNWNPTSKLSTFVRLGWGNNAWTTPTQFGDSGRTWSVSTPTRPRDSAPPTFSMALFPGRTSSAPA